MGLFSFYIEPPTSCLRAFVRELESAHSSSGRFSSNLKMFSLRHEDTKQELVVRQIRRTILGMGLFSFYIEPPTSCLRGFVRELESAHSSSGPFSCNLRKFSLRHQDTKHELVVRQIHRTILGLGIFSFYIEPPTSCLRAFVRELESAHSSSGRFSSNLRMFSLRHEDTKQELVVRQIRRTILGMGLFSFYIEPPTSCEN